MFAYKIKEMKLSDYAAIYEFWKRIDNIGLSGSDTKKEIGKFLKKNPGMSFIAEAENCIIGTVLASHDGRRGYIYHFAVEDRFRGREIGKNMLARVLSMFRKDGIQKCHLFVFKNNSLGKKIWEKLGWTLREDIYMMSKELHNL